MFIKDLKKEMDKKTKRTENGAVGFATSGENLVDLNFRVSSYRNMSEDEIFHDFMKAYNDNRAMAMRWLFYARDVRGGLGERRLFRVILKNLEQIDPKTAKQILHLVAMFGRWDDLFVLVGTSLEKDVFNLIGKQLAQDGKDYKAGKSISILAKWMPTLTASNKERKMLARKIARYFHVSEKKYRQTISTLRAHLGDAVVERKMSLGHWDKIIYPDVCSKANLTLNPAFLKHDEERRREFLNAVDKGEEKINSGTNFPYEILMKYRLGRGLDQGLEVMWKALPDYGNLENTLVVADGSGSMTWNRIEGTKAMPLDVANAFAIYFAEHCEGGFKNHYITFSSRPELVNLGEGSLLSKKKIAEHYSEASNTDIQAVFELILKTAINQEMSPEELPATILIISDMEFDDCARGVRTTSWESETLFEYIGQKFERHGYKLPKLAFWNVCSRSLAIPMKENKMGVVLVSGFSSAAIQMVMGNKLTPYEALVEVLKNPKYDVVEKAIS